MPERSRVAVLISGRGSNMAALIYAARADDCPYEVALVTGDNPAAPGLDLAAAEGVDVVRIPAPTPKDKSQYLMALQRALDDHSIDLVALAGFMRILPDEFVARWDGRKFAFDAKRVRSARPVAKLSARRGKICPLQFLLDRPRRRPRLLAMFLASYPIFLSTNFFAAITT